MRNMPGYYVYIRARAPGRPLENGVLNISLKYRELLNIKGLAAPEAPDLIRVLNFNDGESRVGGGGAGAQGEAGGGAGRQGMVGPGGQV